MSKQKRTPGRNETLDEMLDRLIDEGIVGDYIELVDAIMRRHGFKIEDNDEIGS